MSRPTLAIAGAAGFVGRALCEELAGAYDIVALTRRHPRAPTMASVGGVRWQPCDLFSLSAVRAALRGVEYAIYLVHSLVPTSRLTMARPEDMDLLLADNFSLAAAENGVQQIVFLGGIVPGGFETSRLLWSRREVELALASHGAAVTALRAGLIVGCGGSSLEILLRLVKRLPVLPLPRAARSRAQPIALQDVLRAIRYCLGNRETYGQHFDIGGPEALSYHEMLNIAAKELGRRRAIFTVPLLPLQVVAVCVRLVSGAAPALVKGLVESLPTDTLVEDNPVQRAIADHPLPFAQAVRLSLDPSTRRLPRAQRLERKELTADLRRASLVRSVDRLLPPVGENAAWVAGNYLRWLRRLLWPVIDCRFDSGGSCAVELRRPRINLLTLSFQPKESRSGRRIYRISSGVLVRDRSSEHGRFEFCDVLGGRFTLAAIHDYAPALPWYLYRISQAVVHLLVMRLYQRRLARLAR